MTFNPTIAFVILCIVAVLIVMNARKEGMRVAPRNPCQSGDPAHCPEWCSPFLYPDMYSPQSSCSDPLNWGFTYSTGRCPHAYSPQPRRLPSKDLLCGV